jgi:hypothetical protein
VRQWGKGADPTPSVLQRVGGTLIEIGVNYFANVPGGIGSAQSELDAGQAGPGVECFPFRLLTVGT